MNRGKIAVIGGGVAGLSSACYLRKAGFDVALFEKHQMLGGRARVWEKDGFSFDLGPSWYWMPEIFEEFFGDFNSTVKDHYELLRLDPSYRVFFSNNEYWDLPAGSKRVGDLFESKEKGSALKLAEFLADAKLKYDTGMNDYVRRPSVSLMEYCDLNLLFSLFKLNLLSPYSKHVEKFFKHPKIRQLLEFPVLFLGATANKTPALYSMMAYADIELGTWYPQRGMGSVISGMAAVAKNLGVEINLGCEVVGLNCDDKKGLVKSIKIGRDLHEFDYVVSSADYHHTETALLPQNLRSYSEEYWNSRTLAPSCLLYYFGVNRKLDSILHHNLFFDEDLGSHSVEIYEDHSWPKAPLMYLCAPSITDPSVAPANCENLFALIPVAAGLKDNPEVRDKYRSYVLNKIKLLIGNDISNNILVERSFAYSDFISDYNSFKGNAYGLANTLTQTGYLKPRMQSKKIKNLYFAGQLTVPGPGVPPAIISGKLVSQLIEKNWLSCNR